MVKPVSLKEVEQTSDHFTEMLEAIQNNNYQDGHLQGLRDCRWLFETWIAQLHKENKELEEKLNNEWKPAGEAVVGVEYDVCGGECLHCSEYSDYDEWSPMKSDVAVATREDDTLLESSFTGAYADEHGARWYYRPKWIKERPTPPTQEGDKK